MKTAPKQYIPKFRDISLPDRARLLAETYALRRDGNPLRQSAMSFSCLGKVVSCDAACLERWGRALDPMIRNLRRSVSIGRPLVVGLAESGIVPSALVHRNLIHIGADAGWICSSRRSGNGLAFVERHSHGKDHILPLPPECHHPSPGPDHRPAPWSELWFAEDEITTGQTLFHLCLSMCEALNIRTVRLLAFTDIRDEAQRRHFSRAMDAAHIRFSLHTVLPEFDAANPQKEPVKPLFAAAETKGRRQSGYPDGADQWRLTRIRPARSVQIRPAMSAGASGWTGSSQRTDAIHPADLAGTILPVGEAVDLCLLLLAAAPGLRFRHITLSPWRAGHGVIRSRLDIGDRYYLYNPETLSGPLWILADPVDEKVADAALRTLGAAGYDARMLPSAIFASGMAPPMLPPLLQPEGGHHESR